LLWSQEAEIAGDPLKAAELAAQVPVDSAVRDRAVLVFDAAVEARQRDLIAQADDLAAQSNFAGALALLRGVSESGPWLHRRLVREVDWQRGLRDRAALGNSAERPVSNGHAH
jgi:hypothetical protein